MTAQSWVQREAEKRKELERQQQQKSAARLDRVKEIADKAPALWEKFAAVGGVIGAFTLPVLVLRRVGRGRRGGS